jgi:hypothetical protein
VTSPNWTSSSPQRPHVELLKSEKILFISLLRSRDATGGNVPTSIFWNLKKPHLSRCCVLRTLQMETSPAWGRNKLEWHQVFILLNLKKDDCSVNVIGWDDPNLETLQAITTPLWIWSGRFQTFESSLRPTYISTLDIIWSVF